MGVLSDIVIADISQAKQICKDINSKQFVWKETPDLTAEMLAVLYCMLTQSRYSKKRAKELCNKFCVVYSSNIDSVTSIPDEFLVHLAQVKTNSIPQIAADWREKLGSKFDNYAEDAFENYMSALRKLSRQASTHKSSLLLRQSL
jgi:hypothetical protein